MSSRSLPALLTLALLAALAPPARAAESAVIQEIIDGNQLYVDTRQAKVKQKATAPQQVSTQNSRGQLAFNSGAVGRLNRFSRLRLGQGCFLLDKGQVLVSGKQGGCTRSARLSVRGTNYLLEVDDNGESQLSVLEGEVAVEPLKDGEPTGQPPTTVQAGQRLRLSPEGVVLTLLALTQGDYTQILQGPLFEGFRMPLTNAAALESYVRSRLPGVPLPALPSTPTLPRIGLPRFF
ncbi:MAG: FecR domain-containing protein [Cyanobacteriota bacterium]|nr:FecR domain-containing protein [Cyanobacteriota bacterium]